MKKATKTDFLAGQYAIEIRNKEDLLAVVGNIKEPLRYKQVTKKNIAYYIYPTEIGVRANRELFFSHYIDSVLNIEDTYFSKFLNKEIK